LDYDKILSTFEKLSILYVEDNPDCARLTSEWLEEFFSYVTTCEDGEDGLVEYNRYFEENDRHYDIVLTDINMPILDGLNMSRAIFKINKEQSIVIATAYNDPDYAKEINKLGIEHVVYKPTNMTDILNTLCDATKVIP
jgi:YesN/AraC family two-component response regulator